MVLTLPNWPISRGFADHTIGWGGIDFKIGNGTPLPACFSGKISLSRFEPGGFGNRIDLRCLEEPQFTAVYAHCQNLASVGQQFNRGQIIGHSNNTGLSTGPHLHFTLLLNGKAIDPAPYLKGGEDMVNADLLNAFFIDLLGREPDPGARTTYQDKPDWPTIKVYHAIRTSPERQQFLAKKQIELDNLKNGLATLDTEVRELRVNVKNNDELLKSQGTIIDKQEEEIENQRKTILDQEKEIEALNQRIKEMYLPKEKPVSRPFYRLTIGQKDPLLEKWAKIFINWLFS